MQMCVNNELLLFCSLFLAGSKKLKFWARSKLPGKCVWLELFVFGFVERLMQQIGSEIAAAASAQGSKVAAPPAPIHSALSFA